MTILQKNNGDTVPRGCQWQGVSPLPHKAYFSKDYRFCKVVVQKKEVIFVIN